MAGHNKWSKVKHIKARADTLNVFTHFEVTDEALEQPAS